METLNQVLKVLFQETRSEDILEAYLDRQTEYSGMNRFTDVDMFGRQMVKVNLAHTLDQAEVLYHVLCDKWSQKDPCAHHLIYCNDSNVFNVLLHFSNAKIYLEHHVPVCKYQELLSWHEITRDFGEDLFVTSYLASYDLKNNLYTSHFDWQPCIGHDSTELNQMFNSEMQDIHAHLNGSSLNFELNWMSLMNHISGHESNFEKIDSMTLSDKAIYRTCQNSKSLYIKVIMAAAIRLYLYNDVLSDYTEKVNMTYDINDVLSCKSLEQILMYESAIQNAMDIVGYLYGRKYEDEDYLVSYIPDYAISGEDKSIFSVLGGERRFMYYIFRKIYSGEYFQDRKTSLFFLYLLIKEEFRKELVQMNDTVGFANFSLYQDRKDQFLYNGASLYERLLPQLAVGALINDSNKKRYMEVRIAPKKSIRANLASIRSKDSCITDKVFDRKNIIGTNNYHYVFHFIKKKETIDDINDLNDISFALLPRHAHLREEVEMQAKAIYQIRLSYQDISSRLVGIDAANSEIFCRPEVFAHAFRFLSLNISHDSFDKNKSQDLGMTYHVGEDFYDLIDGLRAVDEVLKFMNFRNGCRLGHALVLGTDVESYYKKRNFRINATKQVILDNVAWLYVQAERAGVSSKILSYLRDMFHKYFQQIYSIVYNREIDIFTYYQSWLLRGDSPFLYKYDESSQDIVLQIDPSYEYMDSWFSAAQNHGYEVDEAHENSVARHLYYSYHYNKNVRIIGNEGDVLRIKPQYREELMDLITNIQQQLLSKLEHLHISIECNPSSNLKIGEIDRYDEHPIVRFYNNGLITPYPRHDICVSINTDDAGVFATSLEREYSLMALAIEKNEGSKMSNTPRSVIEWLDSIRRMTKEQCFYHGNDSSI